MAIRIPMVDDADPKLPAVVTEATRPTNVWDATDTASLLGIPDVIAMLPRRDAAEFGFFPTASAAANAAALAALTAEIIATGQPGNIQPGDYDLEDNWVIDGLCSVFGTKGKTRLHFTGVADCVVVDTPLHVRLDGIYALNDGGCTNGFMSVDTGASTSYQHWFIDCQASLFPVNFSSDHDEHALWLRCWAYQGGIGFRAESTTSTGIFNKWIECRAQDCTGDGFDIDDQVLFTLDVEALDCGGAPVRVRGNTFLGKIDADTERTSGGPLGIGISISGQRHTVDRHFAFGLVTPIESLGASSCEWHNTRYVSCTNGIVYSNTDDTYNLAFDPNVTIFDPNPARSGNRRVPTALMREEAITTLGNDIQGSVPGTSATWQGANEAIAMRCVANRSLTITKLSWVAGTVSAGNYDIGIADRNLQMLWHKGSTAFPSASTGVTDTVSPTVTIPAGQVFYVVLATDSATATFRGALLTSTVEQMLSDGTDKFKRCTTSFPLPAAGNTLTVASASGRAAKVLVRTD